MFPTRHEKRRHAVTSATPAIKGHTWHTAANYRGARINKCWLNIKATSIPPSIGEKLSRSLWICTSFDGPSSRIKIDFSDFASKAGVLPSPCFSIFLARTTSCPWILAGGKNPGQDAIFEDFVFNSSNYWHCSLFHRTDVKKSKQEKKADQNSLVLSSLDSNRPSKEQEEILLAAFRYL